MTTPPKKLIALDIAIYLAEMELRTVQTEPMVLQRAAQILTALEDGLDDQLIWCAIRLIRLSGVKNRIEIDTLIEKAKSLDHN